MGSLADLERNWEIYARSDPMWAVLMDPAKLGNRWDREEFFAAGEAEIATVLDRLAKLGVEPDRSGAALDFGCGVGRLTQALGARFAEAWGVDISATMVARAEGLNTHPERCHYVVNPHENLAAVTAGPFAFVYTSIVLQHMEPRYSRRYLAELARRVSPGGVLVAQVPDHLATGGSVTERARLAGYRLQRGLGVRTHGRRTARRLGLLRGEPGIGEAAVEMHCVPEAEVRAVLGAEGLEILDVVITNSTDEEFAGGLRYLTDEPGAGWVSKQYAALRPA